LSCFPSKAKAKERVERLENENAGIICPLYNFSLHPPDFLPLRNSLPSGVFFELKKDQKSI